MNSMDFFFADEISSRENKKGNQKKNNRKSKQLSTPSVAFDLGTDYGGE